MNPTDPLEALRETLAGIDRVQSDVEDRVPDHQVPDVRDKFDRLRDGLGKAMDRLREVLESQAKGKPEAAVDPAVASKLQERADRAAAAEKARAMRPPPPQLPPPPQIELCDGHTLGKRLLVELGVVAKPSAKRDRGTLLDDAGYRWESTDTWNSLGM